MSLGTISIRPLSKGLMSFSIPAARHCFINSFADRIGAQFLEFLDGLFVFCLTPHISVGIFKNIRFIGS
jgi:hypothetical protein